MSHWKQDIGKLPKDFLLPGFVDAPSFGGIINSGSIFSELCTFWSLYFFTPAGLTSQSICKLSPSSRLGDPAISLSWSAWSAPENLKHKST